MLNEAKNQMFRENLNLKNKKKLQCIIWVCIKNGVFYVRQDELVILFKQL